MLRLRLLAGHRPPCICAQLHAAQRSNLNLAGCLGLTQIQAAPAVPAISIGVQHALAHVTCVDAAASYQQAPPPAWAVPQPAGLRHLPRCRTGRGRCCQTSKQCRSLQARIKANSMCVCEGRAVQSTTHECHAPRSRAQLRMWRRRIAFAAWPWPWPWACAHAGFWGSSSA